MIQDTLKRLKVEPGILIDVGCGGGHLYPFVSRYSAHYIAVDAVRYPGLQEDFEFHEVDLDSGRVDLPDNSGDIVVAAEVIEHLENPRSLVRELARIAKPGALIVVTTPNQLSLLSLITLVAKQRFSAFQDSHYPAHLTALLEVDLVRIFQESALTHIAVHYSRSGRVVLSGKHYPRFFSRVFPRIGSDNILVMGIKG